MKTLSIIATCSLLLIQSLQNLHADTLTSGLIAFYKFDSNIVDSSSQGNNLQDPLGNFTNGMLSYGVDRFGTSSSALNISSANVQLRSMNNLGITGNQSATISMWINPSSDMEGIWLAGFGSLLSPMGAFAVSMKESWPSGRKPVGMSVFNYLPAGIGGTAADGVRGEFGFVLSYWHHLTAVYSSNFDTIAIYLDGQPLSTSDYISSSHSNILNIVNTTLFVGVQPDQDIAGNMKGALDDLRVYNRALSPYEVLALYNLQRPVYEVTLTTKSSTNLNEWTSVLTNKIETYNPTEFYKNDISVTIKPPAP